MICEGFSGLTYTRIASSAKNRSSPFSNTPLSAAVITGGNSSTASSSSSSLHKSLPQPSSDLDTRVDQAVDVFLRSLSQIGPELLSVC